MEVVLKLEDLLEREKEVFNQYIKSQKEIDMLPLLDRFSEEDKKIYSIDDAYRYLRMYTSSNIITKEEQEKFMMAKKVDPILIFKRGKKAVKKLIESNVDEKELFVLASEFSKIDGRIKNYPISYVKNCIEYYKRNTKNTELIKTLEALEKLVTDKNNREFDLSLIPVIISFDDFIASVNFIKSINISFKALKRLIDTYCVLYPGNESDISYLKEVSSILKRQEKNIIPSSDNNISKRLTKLSHLLEIYLTTDIDDVLKIEGKYHMSEYEFNLALKEGIISKEPVIISLIDKYNIKERAIDEYNTSISVSIGNAIMHGAHYGNGNRPFNIIDYFNMNNGLSIEIIKRKVRENFDSKQTEYIIKALESLDFKNAYQSEKDLSASIGVFSKNGRNMSKEEKEIIIRYMVDNNLPINNSVFFAACERYFDGDLEIEVEKKIA